MKKLLFGGYLALHVVLALLISMEYVGAEPVGSNAIGILPVILSMLLVVNVVFEIMLLKASEKDEKKSQLLQDLWFLTA